MRYKTFGSSLMPGGGTMTSATGRPQTTAPTVPQGSMWTNYQATGSATTKPTVDNLTPAMKYTMGTPSSPFSQLTTFDFTKTGMSVLKYQLDTDPPIVPQTNYLKTYLPYIIIGGVGLVTMFALRG